MKQRLTMKEVKSWNKPILKTGAYSMQRLLWFEDPVGYTAGIDGWNADIYEVEGIVIVTGYRSFGQIQLTYEDIKPYENKADQIIHDNTFFNHDVKKLQVQKILHEFVETMLKV